MAFARERLDGARHDLDAAFMLLGADPPLMGVAAFHCQQAVEKTFKGFLVHHNMAFEKQHDCGKLCDLCAGVDPSFRSLRDQAGSLNAYAVNAHYLEEPVPKPEEAHHALVFAREARDFVLDRLPQELRGSAPGP